MSYAENIMALWKPMALKVRHDPQDEYQYGFSLYPKNEQLKSYNVQLHLGIDHLDDLTLKYLVIYKKSIITVVGKSCFRVSHQQVFEYGHVDMIDSTMGNLINEIEGLVFDKYSGKFMNLNNNDLKKHYDLQKTIRVNMEGVPECCVCKEFCGTTTRCGHTLCLECYNKIVARKKCPICRSYISKVKFNN